MSAELLTVIPRLGSLRYGYGALSARHDGWFHIEGETVMRRGLGDTRSWKLCPLDQVIEFVPDPTQP